MHYAVFIVGTVGMSECDSGERSVLAERGRGGLCGVRETAAIDCSPQPVNRKLMTGPASPSLPLLFLLLPPLRDALAVLQSMCFRRELSQRSNTVLQLCGGGQTPLSSA